MVVVVFGLSMILGKSKGGLTKKGLSPKFSEKIGGKSFLRNRAFSGQIGTFSGPIGAFSGPIGTNSSAPHSHGGRAEIALKGPFLAQLAPFGPSPSLLSPSQMICSLFQGFQGLRRGNIPAFFFSGDPRFSPKKQGLEAHTSPNLGGENSTALRKTLFGHGEVRVYRGTGVSCGVRRTTWERSQKIGSSKSLVLKSFWVERTLWDSSLLVSLTLWDAPVLFTPPLPLPKTLQNKGFRTLRRLNFGGESSPEVWAYREGLEGQGGFVKLAGV